MKPPTRPVRRTGLTLLALLCAVLLPANAATAAGAPTVPPTDGTLSRHQVSGVYVSGISSGADMAGQLQVAYSSRIKGMGAFGLSPYYCAENNAAQALAGCSGDLWPTFTATLEAETAQFAAYGWIDPVSDLSGKPVYVYHGGADSVVAAPVSSAAGDFFRHFGARVTTDGSATAGHAWVTPYGPGACGDTAVPFLNNCGTDPEHTMLSTLFGSVSAPATGTPDGTLVRFDQNAYAPGGSAAAVSMDDHGFAYVPAACAAGSSSCRLMVALHGCEQDYATVGTAFEDDSGLDQYADTNHMIVLYPQATASVVNPYGCWDWWGYLGATNYPIKGGAQIETIMNMVTALGG